MAQPQHQQSESAMQLQLQHSDLLGWCRNAPVCWAEDAASSQGHHAAHSSNAAFKALAQDVSFSEQCQIHLGGGCISAAPGPPVSRCPMLTRSGLTKSHQQHAFRQSHPVSQRVGLAASHVAPPKLPSDRQADFTYGKPSTYKSMEEIRVAG